MELFQAGYYREGLQGSNAGWHIVSPSTDMSQTARDGMAGLGSKIAALVVESSHHPSKGLGLFSVDDQYYYLVHVNKSAQGLDSRGVSFTHGYCCNREDFYALCHEPANIFGVKEENFQDEYLQDGAPYPTVSSLSYDPMNLSEILRKYNLNKDNYKNLIWGVLAALDGYSSSFCIKVDCDTDEIPTAYRELMYAVMMGLPYQLRIKLTSYVDAGTVAKVYVSNRCESDAYYDVATGAFASNKDKLNQLHFTRLYGTFAVDSQEFQGILKLFENFVDSVYANPLKNITCERIESAYQAKKNPGVDEELVVDLISYLTGQNLNYGPVLDEYLIKLLKIVVDKNLELVDNKVDNLFGYNASQTQNERYLALYYDWKAARCVKAGNSSFNELWNMYENKNKQFIEVHNRIERISPSFRDTFYEQCLIPRGLADLEKIKACVSGNQNDFNDDIFVRVFALQFSKCIKKEYEKCTSFQELVQAYKKCMEISNAIQPQYGACKKDQFIKTEMWKHFNMDMFDSDDLDTYQNYNVLECAAIAKQNGEQSGAIDVERILGLVDGDITEDDEQILNDIVMNNAYFNSDKERKKFIANMQKRYVENRRNRQLSFDVLLLMYFDVNKRTFNVAKLANDLLASGRQNEFFIASSVKRNIERSKILKNDRNRQLFYDEVERVVKDKSQNQRIVANLRQYYRCLQGKDISDNNSTEGDSFFQSIQRVVVCSFAVMSIAFSLVCFQRYVYDLSWSLLFAAIAAIFFIGGCVVSVILDGGIPEFLENAGVTELPQLLILVGIIVGIGIISTCTLFFGNFVVKAIILIIVALITVGITCIQSLFNND